MSFGAPSPPDPTATSNSQQQYNTTAAKTQNQVNSYNQSNPYGSVNYTADPNSPSGYSVNTSLSAPNQGLLNKQYANQGVAGTNAGTLYGTAGNLANNSAGMYSSPTDLSAATGSTAKLLNSWQQQYLSPIFNQQDSNLEAQLRNQGLSPGSAAYDNAKNLLARNQGDVTNQYLSQNENQAYGQALQNYQLPIQTEAGLLQNAGAQAGYASPTAPTFQQTPTAQVQPPNYMGQVQQNYQQQNQNYENMLSGMFGVGSGLAGGWATGGFKNPFSNALTGAILGFKNG